MYRYEDFGLYIGGGWSPAQDNGAKSVVDPATEDVLGTVPIATQLDLDRALAAAQIGFAPGEIRDRGNAPTNCDGQLIFCASGSTW